MGYKAVHIPVDPDKLKAEFMRRKLTLSDVSRECGYAPGYFSNVCISKWLNPTAEKLLSAIYNIKREDYAPDATEPETPVQTPELQMSAVDYTELQKALNNATAVLVAQQEAMLRDVLGQMLSAERLQNIVYTAVYDAVKKAWSE